MAPRKLNRDLLREIVNLRKAGNSFAEIALLTGVSESTIGNWRRQGAKGDGLCRDLARLLDKIAQEERAAKAKQRQDVFNRKVDELKVRYTVAQPTS